jgi:hypothetical protein
MTITFGPGVRWKAWIRGRSLPKDEGRVGLQWSGRGVYACFAARKAPAPNDISRLRYNFIFVHRSSS